MCLLQSDGNGALMARAMTRAGSSRFLDTGHLNLRSSHGNLSRSSTGSLEWSAHPPPGVFTSGLTDATSQLGEVEA